MAKVGLFDLSTLKREYGWYILEGSSTVIELAIPDGADTIEIRVPRQELLDYIDYVDYVMVITSGGYPVASFNVAWFSYDTPSKSYSISAIKDVKNKKLMFAFAIEWRATWNVIDCELANALEIRFIDSSTGNVLGSESIDVAFYSLESIDIFIVGAGLVLVIDEYIKQRTDFMLIHTYKRYHNIIPALYITEIDANGNVVKGYRAPLDCAKIVPDPNTKKIAISYLPRSGPYTASYDAWFAGTEYRIILFGKYIPGLPPATPPR